LTKNKRGKQTKKTKFLGKKEFRSAQIEKGKKNQGSKIRGGN